LEPTVNSAISELRERVEAATGADRELDALICVALHYTGDPKFQPPRERRWVADPRGFGAVYPLPEQIGTGIDHGSIGDFICPSLTASLDAAIALVEKMLTGQDVLVGRISGKWLAEIGPRDSFKFERAYAPTPALALIAALLKALEARDA
jgi:hypothetical protein